MSKTIEAILAPKPEARPRIYAYSIDDQAHKRLLKVGQTTRAVKQRVAEQLKTANIKNYTIVLNEFAERDDGTVITGPVQKPSPTPSVVCFTSSDSNVHEQTHNHHVLPWLALYFEPALFWWSRLPPPVQSLAAQRNYGVSVSLTPQNRGIRSPCEREQRFCGSSLRAGGEHVPLGRWTKPAPQQSWPRATAARILCATRRVNMRD